MIINFVREQVSMGVIEIRKILGTKNMADIHTKRVRSGDFATKAMQMLGEDDYKKQVSKGKAVQGKESI